MCESKTPIISFVVPTLNRGQLVIRAVRSCLNVGRSAHNVAIQVIVSDAGSTDGSWHELQQAFGNDPRVELVAGRSGSCPTENWLNAASRIQGRYATFVWSDDYIAPHFLDVLLPHLEGGMPLAFGQGAERDVSDETALLVDGIVENIPFDQFIIGYFRRGTLDAIPRPISPPCGLFARSVFDEWIAVATVWSCATPLRRKIMWEGAFGPDLLLFMVAYIAAGGIVKMTTAQTAQFSSHPGSITCSCSRVRFETGYWLAALWSLADDRFAAIVGPKSMARFSASAFLYGIGLTLLAMLRSAEIGIVFRRDYLTELAQIFAIVRRNKLSTRFFLSLASECVVMPLRLMRYLLVRGTRESHAVDALRSVKV